MQCKHGLVISQKPTEISAHVYIAQYAKQIWTMIYPKMLIG